MSQCVAQYSLDELSTDPNVLCSTNVRCKRVWCAARNITYLAVEPVVHLHARWCRVRRATCHSGGSRLLLLVLLSSHVLLIWLEARHTELIYTRGKKIDYKTKCSTTLSQVLTAGHSHIDRCCNRAIIIVIHLTWVPAQLILHTSQ